MTLESTPLRTSSISPVARLCHNWKSLSSGSRRLAMLHARDIAAALLCCCSSRPYRQQTPSSVTLRSKVRRSDRGGQVSFTATGHLGHRPLEAIGKGESTVYRILKREGLVKPPEIQLVAGKEYQQKTTGPHQMWATDASYFRVRGWGYYYLVW